VVHDDFSREAKYPGLVLNDGGGSQVVKFTTGVVIA